MFVHMLPCLALVILNILLFRAMREADRKRERLLKSRLVSAATNNTTNTSTTPNVTKPVGGESKETKKIRDTNNTTLMLVVVITVSVHELKNIVLILMVKKTFRILQSAIILTILVLIISISAGLSGS